MVRLAEGSTIEGFTITSGGDGYAVYGLYVTAAVIGNRIVDNQGGGIYHLGGGLIHKNLVANNEGTGIEIAYSNASIHFNTVADNEGSGITATESIAGITDNIIVNNGTAGSSAAGVQVIGTVVPTIDYNDVWHNLASDYLGCTAGSHDLSDNPNFYDGYCIGAISPCVDAGCDYGDGYQFWNDVPDVGWFEFSVYELPALHWIGLAGLLCAMGILLRRKGVLIGLLIAVLLVPGIVSAETMLSLFDGDGQVGVPTCQLPQPLVVKLGYVVSLPATQDTYVDLQQEYTVLNNDHLSLGVRQVSGANKLWFTYLEFDYPSYPDTVLRTFLRLFPYDVYSTSYPGDTFSHGRIYDIPFPWSEYTATWNNTDPGDTIMPNPFTECSMTEDITFYHELPLSMTDGWFTGSPASYGVALTALGSGAALYAHCYSKEALVDPALQPALLIITDDPMNGVSGEYVSFHWYDDIASSWQFLDSTMTDDDGFAAWQGELPDTEGEIQFMAYCPIATFGQAVYFTVTLVKPVIMGNVNVMSYPGSSPAAAGETVAVINPVEGIALSLTTDVDGHYTTADDPTILPTGDYYVTAEVDHCVSDMSMVTVDPPDTYVQDIQVLCGMIYGRVNSPTGPRSGAVVTLHEAGITQVTTSEGDFLFLVTPATWPATYTLSATYPGGTTLPNPLLVVLTTGQPVAEANFCWLPTDENEFPGDAYTYYPSHFSSPEFDSDHVNLGNLPEETVDTFTGQLHLHYIDLALPGKGGLDLNLIRTYASTIRERAPWVDDTQYRTRFTHESCLGLGWDLHFGRIDDPAGDAPVMVLPDGSRQAFHTVPSSAPTGYPKYSTERWRLDDLGAGDLLVTSPAGVHYFFAAADCYTVTNVMECWQREYAAVTEIRSADADGATGNRITITYTYTGGRHVITQVVDTYGRAIDFTYDPSTGFLTGITGPNGSVELEYEVTAISTDHAALTRFTAYAAGTGGSPGDLQTTYGYGSAIADADYCRL
ncbi:DNRLRE domain-containing protein, partial [bacterium]|nr:DNRLRE domain-containing protein [candidate division CSSED10-310 bacterium]